MDIIHEIAGWFTYHGIMDGLGVSAILSILGFIVTDPFKVWRRKSKRIIEIRAELYQALAEIRVSTQICLLVFIELSSNPEALDSIDALLKDYPKPGTVERNKELLARLNPFRTSDRGIRREIDAFQDIVSKLACVTSTDIPTRVKEIYAVDVTFAQQLEKHLDHEYLVSHLRDERTIAYENAYLDWVALLPPFLRMRERFLKLMAELKESLRKSAEKSDELKKILEEEIKLAKEQED